METVFFRLLQADDKAAALADATAALRDGRPTNPVVHVVNPASFRQVPGSPFAYWVSERIRRLFTELNPFHSGSGEVLSTNPLNADFRYARVAWEIDPRDASEWKPWAKGGAYSPYYFDIHTLIHWDEKRQTYMGFAGTVNRPLERPASLQHFFRAGLTWPRRTQGGLGLRIMPRGCIFADKGPAAFAKGDDPSQLLALVALTNAGIFRMLVELQMCFGSYEVGVIQRTPIPDISGSQGTQLSKLGITCVNLKRHVDREDETSHVFHLPALLRVPSPMLASGSLRGKFVWPRPSAVWPSASERLMTLLSGCTASKARIGERLSPQSVVSRQVKRQTTNQNPRTTNRGPRTTDH